MRSLPLSLASLAAATLQTITVSAQSMNNNGTGDNRYVRFDEHAFEYGPGSGNVVLQSELTRRPFQFYRFDNVSINSVSLFSGGKSIAVWSTTSQSTSGGGIANGPESPQASSSSGPVVGPSSTVVISADVTSPTGKVTVQQWQASYNDGGLYFEVDWVTTNTPMGHSLTTYQSWSQLFAVASDDQHLKGLQYRYMNYEPEQVEVSPDSSSTTTVATTASLNAAATSAPVSAATTTSSSATETPASASTSSSSGGGGLSKGAIAGIAVGCGVVGLALIGLALWFLCFRRRRDGVSNMPYGADRQHTQDLIVEKEAHTGVNEGPHSPYSDDGAGRTLSNGQGEVLMGAGGAAPGQHDHAYDPYRDHPSAAPLPEDSSNPEGHAAQHYDEHGSSAGSPQAATATEARSGTPQGLSARYAHLMEEGMTEDEMRRLEEEERQLDAAILEAGRH